MLPIKTILHPTDFSEPSQAAFELARALARDYQARLIFTHVQAASEVAVGEFGITPPPLEEEVEELQEKLFALEPADENLPTEHFFLTGDPATEIVRLATENDCDLIVMGTHGRSGLGRMLMGSVAEQVMRRAPCPVLTIKHPVPAFASR